MRILVCLKQVPDTNEVKMGENYTLERDFIAQIMNPADESALELGLQLRDLHGGSVTVVTMGPERAESMLREAVSRGADEAILMTDKAFAGADTLITARCLRACAEHLGSFDVILCGRRASDGETGQVGPMLASMLNIPCVANAVKVRWENEVFCIDQLTEEGTFFWQAHKPALVTLCEWTYRLRLPTLKGLKLARQAEVRQIQPSEIGLSPSECGLKASPTRVVKISAKPVGVRSCQKITVSELLPRLRERGVLS